MTDWCDRALMNTGVPHKAGNCLPAPPCGQDRMSLLWYRWIQLAPAEVRERLL